MTFKIGHVILGTGLVAAGGLLVWSWWRKRAAPNAAVPAEAILKYAPPPPTKRLPVQVSSDVSADSYTSQDLFTGEGQTGSTNAVPSGDAGAANVSNAVPSVMPPEETEDAPFDVAIPSLAPKVNTYISMDQLVIYLETEENRKYGHPSKLDEWIKGHIAGLEVESEVRRVLEGKEA